MTTFYKIGWWQRFVEFVFPWRRHVRERRMREHIRWLVRHENEEVRFK